MSPVLTLALDMAESLVVACSIEDREARLEIADDFRRAIAKTRANLAADAQAEAAERLLAGVTFR